MPKSTPFSNDLALLLFNATAIANLADNAAASPLTSLYLSLHTASPGVGGSQLTNEVGYTSYARIAITRSGAGWTVNGSGAATNAALAQFPTCTGSPATITHVAIGTAASGAGSVLYSGALTDSLAVSNLIRPQFEASGLVATES